MVSMGTHGIQWVGRVKDTHGIEWCRGGTHGIEWCRGGTHGINGRVKETRGIEWGSNVGHTWDPIGG